MCWDKQQQPLQARIFEVGGGGATSPGSLLSPYPYPTPGSPNPTASAFHASADAHNMRGSALLAVRTAHAPSRCILIWVSEVRLERGSDVMCNEQINPHKAQGPVALAPSEVANDPTSITRMPATAGFAWRWFSSRPAPLCCHA